MSADPRTDPPTPDPEHCRDCAGSRVSLTGDHYSECPGIAALPSAPDQRLREAIDAGLIAFYETHIRYVYHSAKGQREKLANIQSRESWRKPVEAAIRAALSEATTSPEATLDVERIIADVRGSTPHDDSEYRRGFDRALDKIAARLRGPA